MAKIINRLEYITRIVTTGLGFLLFTLMGLAFRFIACPLLALRFQSTRHRELAARKIVQKSFSFFIAVLKHLKVLELEVHGREKLLSQGLLICPTHPTLIDVVILMSMIPNANCIVKAKLKQSVALKSPIETAGYIANDDGMELLDSCVASLKRNDSLIIFPEGTRTTPGVKPRLKHGAAAVALAAQTNITPVKITCEPPALMKGIAWYVIPKRRMHISVTVCDTLSIDSFLALQAQEGRPVAIRRLTTQLANRLFSK